MFVNYDKDFSNYLIEEVKDINDDLNTGDRRSDTSVTKDSSEINLAFIMKLLDDIYLYADQIALRC